MGSTLDHKIKILFEYRQLPILPSLSSVFMTENDLNSFFINLEYLQKTIYFLDHELESKYEIDQNVLDKKWTDIYHALDLLGVEDHHDYCEDIYRYQSHELSIRQGNGILKLPLEFFYYFKSCDVKLLRRIIYDRFSDLQVVLPLESWKTFDLITEINDDVEDVYEDLGTINGNRYMLDIQKYGIVKTSSNYRSFLNCIQQRWNSNTGSNNSTMINALTEKVYHNTIQLIDQREIEMIDQGLMRPERQF